MNIRKYPRLYSLYLLVLLPSVAMYVITMEQKYSQKECEIHLLKQELMYKQLSR